ncbi:MAG: magnesium/cobalt transporter CorA [Fimbriimonadaceae bacterium]|nr:magnesium/cobalt transporter CorA [Fimbriimonadaceae bacterium]QYK57088.1 MAG: magnesium/cobalt transporter CorA [Fimbriimonadaceae bacterium]
MAEALVGSVRAAQLVGLEARPLALPGDQVDPDALLWVNAVASDLDHLPEVARTLVDLCPLTIEDALSGHMRAGIERRNGVFGFMLTATHFYASEPVYQPVAVFASARRIVTLTREPVPVVDEVFQDWIEDTDDVGPDQGTLLHSLLDALVDGYFPVLDTFHEKIEDLEDTVFEQARVQPGPALALKRDLLVMRKQIAPVRDNINALVRYGEPLVPKDQILAFNDVYNHCMRLSENIDLGRDILTSIMDAQIGLVSNRLNEVMRTLTVVSTLLMVSSLIAGIYGMNFQYMPELQLRYGYPLALVSMVVASLVVIAVFKRRGYL